MFNLTESRPNKRKLDPDSLDDGPSLVSTTDDINTPLPDNTSQVLPSIELPRTVRKRVRCLEPLPVLPVSRPTHPFIPTEPRSFYSAPIDEDRRYYHLELPSSPSPSSSPVITPPLSPEPCNLWVDDEFFSKHSASPDIKNELEINEFLTIDQAPPVTITSRPFINQISSPPVLNTDFVSSAAVVSEEKEKQELRQGARGRHVRPVRRIRGEKVKEKRDGNAVNEWKTEKEGDKKKKKKNELIGFHLTS